MIIKFDNVSGAGLSGLLALIDSDEGRFDPDKPVGTNTPKRISLQSVKPHAVLFGKATYDVSILVEDDAMKDSAGGINPALVVLICEAIGK
jgi:hypothetical protein